MTSVLFEISLIFVLLIGNGVFAMTEIAIVSSRRGKLQAMADAGNQGAARAIELSDAPDRFLSTVQIGITVVGILASMFGGAKLAERLARVLDLVPWLGPFSNDVAFVIVIGALTYFSLIIGELVPKRLAMHHPEAIASAMSRPMDWLSRTASPVVNFLSGSTGAILRVFGVRRTAEEKMSKEEFAVLIREGLVAGTIEQPESRMMEGVFAFEKLDVYDVMTPRPKISWIDVDATHEETWPKIVRSSQSYFPVYQKERDNLVGVISIKDCYAQLAAGIPVSFRHLMRPPLMVPETQMASSTLEMFRSTGVHVAFVMDEHGGVTGMVTLIDLMEAIVGDVPTVEERRALTIQQRHEGSWLIDAMMEIDKLGGHLDGFQTPAGAGDEYQTIAGFFSMRLGRLPVEGDRVAEGGWIFEIVDMDGIRVDKVIASVDPDAPKPVPPPVETAGEFPMA
jgi:putative hemolysin